MYWFLAVSPSTGARPWLTQPTNIMSFITFVYPLITFRNWPSSSNKSAGIVIIYNFCRNTYGRRIFWNILGYDSTGSNGCIITDLYSLDNTCVGTNIYTITNDGVCAAIRSNIDELRYADIVSYDSAPIDGNAHAALGTNCKPIPNFRSRWKSHQGFSFCTGTHNLAKRI